MSKHSTSLMIAVGAAASITSACSPSARPATSSDTNPTGTPGWDAAAIPMGSPDSGGGPARDGADNTDGATDAPMVDAQSNDASSSDSAPPTAPRCDPSRSWGSIASVPSLPTATFARFGGISNDELTVAWTSSTGAIYVADRVMRNGAFAVPTAPSIDPTSMPIANDRAGLGPTGKVLIAVSSDRSRLLAFNRTMVGSPWTLAATLQFANVTAMAAADTGSQFSEPVLGADDGSLFYLLTSPSASTVLFESKWDAQAHAWATGVPVLSSALDGGATVRRRATAASSDGRTLFFFDEVMGQERAAWRDTPTSPLTQFANLPGLSEAAPNYLCNTLYFRGIDTDSGAFGAFIAQ
jgi:hypothetical protein